MATDYKKYLAMEVLNEDRIITYRLLSRAMKVHVNVAKEMLFEFHRNENKKKAGSVHATYLVAGSRYEPETTISAVMKDGDDVVMQSSQPFPSSPPEIRVTDIEDDTPILSITHVREEDLDEARKSYESISSIHVYSLGPTRVKDLQAISDANREVAEKYAGQNGAEYGTITNKSVRKRTIGGSRLAPANAIATAKPKPAVKKEEIKKPEPTKTAEPASATGAAKQPALKGKTSSTNFFSQPSNAAKKDSKASTPAEAPPSSTATKPAALKRGNSGSIFASFAKAKPKAAASESSAASSAAQSPASVPEDEPMKDVSDDEEDDLVAPPPKPRAKKETVKKEPVKRESAADRKSRTVREEALAKMMDEASDEEPSKSATPVVDTPDEEEEVEELQLPKREKPEPKEYVEISGGRRRGKRRVMKKKTLRDEEGYLVTKEEPAWESFSEDEPVAKAKPAPSQASQKKKPAAGKAGQGSIMSFFAKKG